MDNKSITPGGYTPPSNPEAEQSVLGAILVRPKHLDAVIDLLTSKDFYRPAHGMIFQAMCDLAQRSEPVDLVTVAALMKERKQLQKVGGPVFLAALSEQVGFAVNVEKYASLVKDKAILRQLLDISQEMAGACLAPVENVAEFLNAAEEKIYAVASLGHTSQLRGMGELVPAWGALMDRIQKTGITGVPTGFTDLDRKLHGLSPGDLYILAARPSMGKTALALNIAYAVAANTDCVVPFFSLEMSEEQLMTRLVSGEARIDGERLRMAFLDMKEWSRVEKIKPKIMNTGLMIDDTPALTATQIRSRCRKAASKGKLGLVVVDYLQLMRGTKPRQSREQEVAEISMSLKALAKELRVPVLALAQLNRSCEARDDKRPILADLRDSGQIEQDADVVVFLYRDEVYRENSPDKGTAEALIRKHRNGPIGKVVLGYNGAFVRFDSIGKGKEVANVAK